MRFYSVRCFLFMLILTALSSPFLSSGARAQSIGELAPAFSVVTRNGADLQLSDLRGTVVVLNFWASWCGPCREELPFLAEFYDEQRDNGFEVLAINVDADPEAMESFIEGIDFEMPFPVIPDPEGMLPALYDIPGMPTVVFIDKKGVVRHLHSGFRSSYEDTYRNELIHLLGEGE